MSKRDLMSYLDPKRVISPVSVSDNTAQVGQIIDTRDHDSLTYIISAGSLADADATFTVLVEEGDDSGLSDAAAVADAELVGTEALASFQFDDDDKVFKIGYVGNKRYNRLTIQPANNTGSAHVCVTGILGHAHSTPTANPPA